MKYTFNTKGLTCPHCSAKIEKELLKREEISYARVNIVDETTELVCSVFDKDELLSLLKETVERFEEGVTVSHFEEQKEEEHSEGVLRLVIGGAAFLAVLAAKLFGLDINIVMILSVAVYLMLGYDVLLRSVKNISKGRVFDENFLMSISTIGAFVLKEPIEAMAVMLFYQVGEHFEHLAVKRSKKEIDRIISSFPEDVNVVEGDTYKTVKLSQVNAGDVLVVKKGEKFPVDGVVISGNTSVDVSMLTGEPLPVDVNEKENVLSGSLNIGDTVFVKAEKDFTDSTANKINKIIKEAVSKKAPTESFITKFAEIYTPVVVLLAVVIAVVPALLGYDLAVWARRAIVFLIISCPCALVISVPLSYFSGLGAASRKGILIKGCDVLERLNYVKSAVFDKTGTLTEGSFKVNGIEIFGDSSKEDLYLCGYVSECFSTHPISECIASYIKENHIGLPDINEISEFRIKEGTGVSAKYRGHVYSCENKINNNVNTDTTSLPIYALVDGKPVGVFYIDDVIKNTSKEAVSSLKNNGIHTYMLTGDDSKRAREVSENIGLDEYKAELLPADKVREIEKIKKNGVTLFVGDGLNDAPVMLESDVGIAMGGIGSDSAIEAADAVLANDDPIGVFNAYKIAKKTHKIVIENIVFSIGVKMLFLLLGAVGLIGMGPAVFADVGVTVLAVLNSWRLLKG